MMFSVLLGAVQMNHFGGKFSVDFVISYQKVVGREELEWENLSAISKNICIVISLYLSGYT